MYDNCEINKYISLYVVITLTLTQAVNDGSNTMIDWIELYD